MKLKAKMRKGSCLLLVLVQLAGLFFLPQMSLKTQAADGSVETAAGTLPSVGSEDTDEETEATEEVTEPTTKDDSSSERADGITQQTVYYWHKGLPPADGREYPVLMVWEDKYYFAVDASVLKWIVKAEYGKDGAYWVEDDFAYPGMTSGGHSKGNGYPKGNYSVEVGYPAAENAGLVSDLDFEYSVLKETGTAVTFSLPSVPVMKQVAKAKPERGRGETEEDMTNRVIIGLKPSNEMIEASGCRNYFKSDETNWLAGIRYMNYNVTEDSILGVSYDYSQKRIFRWFLHPINEYTIEDLPKRYPGMQGWNNRKPFVDNNLENLSFFVSMQDNKYVFTTEGFKYNTGRISGSFDGWRELQNMANWNASIELGHRGAVFASFGNRPVYREKEVEYWLGNDHDNRQKFGFDIYYGEPNLMYFLKSDIVVESGQTQTLDGPMVIEEGTKIIVKNGGSVSFTDWIVNKGEILIEPGGSMIVQQNTIPSGLTRNCALIGDNKEATSGGRIACDGLMIVMPNCTVAGAGIYGIQFGEGAQCVNYGSLVSEVWDVRMDYTAENRANTSYVYMGWSVVDQGYSLTAATLEESNRKSLGYFRDYTTPARYVVGWLYGEYQSNFSLRPGSSSMGSKNRGGRVTP